MPGVFNINIKDGIVYKSLSDSNKAQKIQKRIKTEKNKYIYHITNSCKLPIIGEYIPECIDVNTNGSYSMKFIEGINLMDLLKKEDDECKNAGWISKEIKLEKNIIEDIIVELTNLEEKLYEYNKQYTLRGDWYLHNLIYNINSKRIYNVDLEGFYTYCYKHKNCNPVCKPETLSKHYKHLKEYIALSSNM